jgi:NADPH-dependent 2,4-dienoyl-CoA reductase/sulfur reductase-like enzyme/rhodanese-related sulfurtransferase
MTEQTLRIVVVGGVAGGATAAARARRLNARADITVIEKGPAISFANCGLPYHLGGEIAERSKLLVATKELFWNRFRIRVHTDHEVTSIDRASQMVHGVNKDGKNFAIPYDKLILSTGSEPIRPPFFEAGLENAFHLWTLNDLDQMLAMMQTQTIKRATVIGAGFVGLEVVEQLVRRGMDVTLVERLPQVLGPLDHELAKLVEEELVRNRVAVHLDASVQSLERDGNRAIAVNLADGTKIPTELVIVGAGVRPRTQLATQAGLSLGQSGCVKVNQFMQSDDPNIYAVGDMAEYEHGVLEGPTRMPLAGPANRSGRIAGSHAASGTSLPMASVLGTSIVRVFDITAGTTGLGERGCRAAGIDFKTATIQAGHHASYFPGAKNLTLKLMYRSEDGQILGAQAVGELGCDKRLDVIATAIHFGGTVDDLTELDLAYAPPFGSAKDPIHMVGFTAENDLEHHPILAHFESDLSGCQVVDVRNAAEIQKLPLPGAKHIPVDEISDRWQELDPNQPTIVVCHSGKRAHVAASWLIGQGFSNVKNLNGGMSMRRLGNQG